jgi:hypothetical protein
MTGHKDQVAVRGGGNSRSSRCNRPLHDRPIWHGTVGPGGPVRLSRLADLRRRIGQHPLFRTYALSQTALGNES